MKHLKPTMKISFLLPLATALLLGFPFNIYVDGCQACLAAPVHHAVKERQLPHQLLSRTPPLFSKELFSRSILRRNHAGLLVVSALRGMKQSIERHPAAKPMMVLGAGAIISQRVLFQGAGSRTIPLWQTANDDKESSSIENEDASDAADSEEDAEVSKPMTSAMVGTIGIYKNYISPLLPPACRFLPTCSQCE